MKEKITKLSCQTMHLGQKLQMRLQGYKMIQYNAHEYCTYCIIKVRKPIPVSFVIIAIQRNLGTGFHYSTIPKREKASDKIEEAYAIIPPHRTREEIGTRINQLAVDTSPQSTSPKENVRSKNIVIVSEQSRILVLYNGRAPEFMRTLEGSERSNCIQKSLFPTAFLMF